MCIRRLTITFALCAAAILPVSPVRAETADSIMESKKTLPRHKEVKKLGVHHSTSCSVGRQCRADHQIWLCFSRATAAGQHRCICTPTARHC